MRRHARRPPVPEMGLDVPWAIRGESARLIEQQLQRFMEHPKELAERYELEVAAWEKRDADPFRDGPGYEMHGNVALIRFEGVVTKALSFWGWIFGGSASTEVLLETLKSAELDGAVKAVCLRVDSPGGTTRGVQLASDAIFAFRTKKAIWGLASDCAASSAFNILASCTKVYADSITAEVGSIGTMISFSDYSQMLAASGIRRELIVSSPLKGTGSFGSSLSPEQRAYLQATVDTLTAKFKGNVARGRSFSTAQIDLVSDGRCYQADEALALGLIDGISTLEALLGPLQAEPPVIPLPVVTGPVEPPEDDEEDDSDETESKTGVPLTAIGKRARALLRSVKAGTISATAATKELNELKAEQDGAVEGFVLQLGGLLETLTKHNTDRAESAARDGAPAAEAEAPKESEMNEEEARKLNETLARLEANAKASDERAAAAEARAAKIEEQLAATAKEVAETKELGQLFADLRGDNKGPIRLAKNDKLTEDHLRLRYKQEGLAATQKWAEENLKVIGSGTRTAAQQLAEKGLPGAKTERPVEPVEKYVEAVTQFAAVRPGQSLVGVINDYEAAQA